MLSMIYVCVGPQTVQAQAAQASSVSGVVLDAATRAPIPAVEVWVRSNSARVLTDSLGRFAIRGLAAGLTTIHARRLGYWGINDTLSLIAGGETIRELLLAKQPVVLDTVRTTAETRPQSVRLRRFEERQKLGIGRFITDSVLRRYDNTALASVLSRLPGVRLVPYKTSNYLASTRARRSG